MHAGPVQHHRAPDLVSDQLRSNSRNEASKTHPAPQPWLPCTPSVLPLAHSHSSTAAISCALDPISSSPRPNPHSACATPSLAGSFLDEAETSTANHLTGQANWGRTGWQRNDERMDFRLSWT
jgi:hypothetical protein